MREKTTRREMLRTCLGGIGAAMVSLSASGGAKRRPNFIIILADDLGYGDIAGFGTKPLPYATPRLQRMADEGARLTDFSVPMPFCAPTRASLLTGRYPFHHTVVGNPTPDAGINDAGLPPNEVTIAEALKTAGYATCCIGKWHLGHTPPFLPRTQGFDEYFGILYSNDMRPVQLVENETVVEYPVVQATLTRRYTDRALDFLERNRNRPFFLYLPHAMPHKPLAASEDFYTPETPDDLYADVIRELDFSVGRILDTLKKLGLDENTMVIFTSDNGPWYGGSTGGLRGMKGRSWEGGYRVPLIARWPGRIPAGVVNNQMAGIIDIMPTVLAAAGIEPPKERPLDGKDIMPLLRSADAPSPHEALFGMTGANVATVRSGKWKLHVRAPAAEPKRPPEKWTDPRGPDGVTILAPYEQYTPAAYPGVAGGDVPKPLMLFDLEADPAEQHDVAAQHPEVVARLKAIYDRTVKDLPELSWPKGTGKLRRVKGGALKYD
ncbi:MAG: sulfatase [Candidatus Sumerlaeia bacterium]|nr:sulfatase [Candidatus Sumerlaeia bacterium]